MDSVDNILQLIAQHAAPSETTTQAFAHCDGPCGVYDPAELRIHAEAVYSMTVKINKEFASHGPSERDASFWNTITRYVKIKEEQAHLAKTDLLTLWTDFFKPANIDATTHELFWNAAKQCSKCKYTCSNEEGIKLLAYCKKIHQKFWAAAGKDVTFYFASNVDMSAVDAQLASL
eukprot:g4255.t1